MGWVAPPDQGNTADEAQQLEPSWSDDDVAHVEGELDGRLVLGRGHMLADPVAGVAHVGVDVHRLVLALGLSGLFD